MHQHCAGGRDAIAAIAKDYGYLNERHGRLLRDGRSSDFGMASVTVIS